MSLLSDPDYPGLVASWYGLPDGHRGPGSWAAMPAGYLDPEFQGVAHARD